LGLDYRAATALPAIVTTALVYGRSQDPVNHRRGIARLPPADHQPREAPEAGDDTAP
jgi:hypothetical protein